MAARPLPHPGAAEPAPRRLSHGAWKARPPTAECWCDKGLRGFVRSRAAGGLGRPLARALDARAKGFLRHLPSPDFSILLDEHKAAGGVWGR